MPRWVSVGAHKNGWVVRAAMVVSIITSRPVTLSYVSPRLRIWPCSRRKTTMCPSGSTGGTRTLRARYERECRTVWRPGGVVKRSRARGDPLRVPHRRRRSPCSYQRCPHPRRESRSSRRQSSFDPATRRVPSRLTHGLVHDLAALSSDGIDDEDGPLVSVDVADGPEDDAGVVAERGGSGGCQGGPWPSAPRPPSAGGSSPG